MDIMEKYVGTTWENNKNKTKYVIVGICINATNNNAGQIMFRYVPVEGEGKTSFVRETHEFLEKFTLSV